MEYFETIGGLAALTVIVSQLFISNLHIQKGSVKQMISWIVPIILSVVGLVFQIGMFTFYGSISEPIAWAYTILTGFFAGLVSNGIYDISIVKELLNGIVKK